ncbi:helix-turn-helix transcriptional regulator, partial [Crenobacter intestini]
HLLVAPSVRLSWCLGKEGRFTSPLRYIKEIRLNKAKSLLVHEHLPINVVLEQVGYKSASQFSREFKEYFGHPPSEAANISYSYIKQ